MNANCFWGMVFRYQTIVLGLGVLLCIRESNYRNDTTCLLHLFLELLCNSRYLPLMSHVLEITMKGVCVVISWSVTC